MENAHLLTLLLTILLLLSSSPPLTLSTRSIHPHPTPTTLLDVSASIHQTLQALSTQKPHHHPQQQQQQHIGAGETEISGANPTQDLVSVSLHPRSSLHAPAHRDYRSLTLARLRRDSARVRSLTLKQELALRGLKRSDLDHPVATTEGGAHPEDLEGPVVSGMSQGSGEYFSRVGIGRPPKALYMVVDTGSDVTWVQCAPCTDCYQQADPIYQPSASASYAAISCDTPQCRSLDVSACRNNSCLYQVSYGDGSYTVGDFASETLTLGSSGAVDAVAIGCGHDNEGLFVGAAGLLGLGAGALSFPSQIKAPAFSYCLVDRDSSSASSLQFGAASFPPNAVTTPLLKSRQADTFYFVELAGISVGGEMVAAGGGGGSNGGVIVDSGTAVTRLETAVYEAVRDKFRGGARGLPAAEGVALFDTCYDLSGRESVRVPTVEMHFGGGAGKSVKLPARNYLVPVDSAGTFCFAFAPTSSSLQIIGNVQQQGIRVGFDLQKSTVGFAPNSC